MGEPDHFGIPLHDSPSTFFPFTATSFTGHRSYGVVTRMDWVPGYDDWEIENPNWPVEDAAEGERA